MNSQYEKAIRHSSQRLEVTSSSVGERAFTSCFINEITFYISEENFKDNDTKDDKKGNTQEDPKEDAKYDAEDDTKDGTKDDTKEGAKNVKNNSRPMAVGTSWLTRNKLLVFWAGAVMLHLDFWHWTQSLSFL